MLAFEFGRSKPTQTSRTTNTEAAFLGPVEDWWQSLPVVPNSVFKFGWIVNALVAVQLVVVSFPSQACADELHERLENTDVVAKLKPFREMAAAYCADCHSGADAEARLDVDSLTSSPIGKFFSDWRRIERVMNDRSMPPADAEQPSDAEFEAAKRSVDDAVRQAIDEAAADPGPNLLRRLTNAEYEYCIEDLTGVRLNLKNLLISDSVGGSGFTNSATGQFMNDVTLERYLEAAKLIADHAMIGSGPLYFYKDPGLTGLELSAVERIQSIYRAYGFRASAGEGAEPYGLERFATAFHVAWRYRYRKQLGRETATLQELAKEAEISGKFAQHIWDVLHSDEPDFPLSFIVDGWNAFPSPDAVGDEKEVVAQKSMALFEQMQTWQNRLAEAAGQEEAALLTGRSVSIPSSVDFEARAIRKRKKLSPDEVPDLTNPKNYEQDSRVRLEIRVEPASADVGKLPAVVFSKPEFRFDLFDGTDLEPQPLKHVLTEPQIEKLRLGANPGGQPIGDDEFSIQVGQSKTIEIVLPEDVRYGELTVRASLDEKSGQDAVVRCSIQDVTTKYDPLLGVGSREYSALLRDTNSSKMDDWVAGLTEFATALPQISHREPTPSDRDPIPPLFNNKYNRPERNYFHTAVKYYRVDDYLVRHVLASEQLTALDQAWTDLLTSFNYHNVTLRFAAKKHGVELGHADIRSDAVEWLGKFPQDVRPMLAAQKRQHDAMQHALRAAEQRHLRDVITFAESAWRRPLLQEEISELNSFYSRQRNERELTHHQAVRAVLVRVLVSPDFLYRLERISKPFVVPASAGSEALFPPKGGTTNRTTSDLKFPSRTVSRAPDSSSSASRHQFELASRLSFSIWSSLPDDSLFRAARDGSLFNTDVLHAEVARLLRSPKSRRMATEFFGQWFGFYNFDEFRGVDVQRFPEFDNRLKESLYDEAISFFEHLIREDRPYTEIIQANYAFLDARSAKHYGIDLNEKRDASLANAERALDHRDSAADKRIRKVAVDRSHRGGLLGLGAVLTTTSAPLRTSPVKRGDWILRRLLGTPVPPPPADAGSIPAEEVLGDGLTVRKRLEAHRTRAECMNCHVRIDPLGFALENFDSLGRWRDTYSDDQTIDASGTLANGDSIHGFVGLKKQLAKEDESFRRTFATKLVAYFLGRPETVSDAALIERITADLRDDPKISTAVKTLVGSVQFQGRPKEATSN